MQTTSGSILLTMLRRSFLLVGALALAPNLAGELPGQARHDTTAVLIGEVQSAMSGDPVISAIVFLRASRRGAVTDSAGGFTIDSILPGIDTLVIRYPGLDVQSTVMEFAPQQEVRAVFLLAEKIFQVAELQVEIRAPSADERAITRRMRTGQGYFITREELLRNAIDRPSDALRGVPRVEVRPYRGVDGQLVLIGFGTLACEPSYVVDGTLMEAGFILDDVRLDEIELIEIYRGPAEVPTQYRGNTNRCGLIAIRIRSGGPD